VNGTTVTGPTTVTSWAGWQLTLAAVPAESVHVRGLVGRRRRDAFGHDPGTPATYTATYKKGKK
jgi:hypothetical protein